MSKVLAACLLIAAQTHGLPPAALLGIYQVEQGKPGQEVANENGTYDLGPMQINTVWIPQVARQWDVSEEEAYQWVRDDVCVNVDTAAWILNKHISERHNLKEAIAQYHSRTPGIGDAYERKVETAMVKNGLVSTR